MHTCFLLIPKANRQMDIKIEQRMKENDQLKNKFN